LYRVINLYINERPAGNVTVLDLKGRLRIGGSTVALHNTIRTLAQEGKTMILLNLAGVSYIDSCGLGELIAGHITLRKKGGEIKLLNVAETVRELMAVSDLLAIFDIYETESEALAGFASRGLTEEKPKRFLSVEAGAQVKRLSGASK
jgi:anti-anti-sigma factor